MLDIRTLLRRAPAAAGTLAIILTASYAAADILDDWGAVKAPPPPQLKEVKLDPSTTALLILDMMKANCAPRPRCVASVAAVKRVHDAARAANVWVWYSFVGNNATPADMVDPGFPPHEGEYESTGGPDKFIGTHLEEKLKAHNIKTAVICGTSFQGAGAGAASGLAQRRYNVVVPIDCLSSEDTYTEQYAVWHLYKGGPGGIVSRVTLTRSTMLKFSAEK